MTSEMERGVGKSKEEADLSVLILSYNRPEYLKEAVRSVLEQDLRPKSITILDNGSTAPVRQALEEELSLGVRWEGSDITHPSIWNFRRAIERAQGKYFYMMHDDDRLLPNFISTTYRFLEENPDFVAVGCNAWLIDSNGRRMGNRLLRNAKTEVKKFSNPAEMAYLYSDSFIPFPSIVYRTGSPQMIKLREEYGKVGDSLFLCELSNYGRIAYLTECHFEYRIHTGQDSNLIPFDELRRRDDLLIEMARSDERIFRKVVHNVSVFETKQAMIGVLKTAIGTMSPRQTLKRMEMTRSPNFNPLHLGRIAYENRLNGIFWLLRLMRE